MYIGIDYGMELNLVDLGEYKYSFYNYLRDEIIGYKVVDGQNVVFTVDPYYGSFKKQYNIPYSISALIQLSYNYYK
jgi:hypothetical protein